MRRAREGEIDWKSVPYRKKFEPEEDQLGVLYGRLTKRGTVVLSGKLATDAGEVDVVGFPFVTRMFRSGITICLARSFDKEGNSVRADGEMHPPHNSRY